MSGAPGLPQISGSPTPAPVGLFQFSIEGRRAPALFVTGWVALLVGLGATIVGFLSGPGGGSILLLGVGLAIVSIALLLLGGSQAVEREAAGRDYAGPSPVLVVAAAFSCSFVAILAIGTPLELSHVQVPRPVGDLLLEAIQAIVTIGVVRLLVVGSGAITWRDMGFGVPRSQAAAGVVSGVVFAIPLIFVTGVVGAALIGIFKVTPPPPLPATGTTSGLLINLVTAAVIAPIAEEILFRGVMVTAWARTGRAWTVILRSAILFAGVHVLTTSGDSFGQAASLAFVAAATRIPVAIGLGWVYLRSGTIWASIGMHAAFNGLILVIAEQALQHPS